MSDFYRASPTTFMANYESTETENCYSSLNRELRWLWNSVYLNVSLSEFVTSAGEERADFFCYQFLVSFSFRRGGVSTSSGC